MTKSIDGACRVCGSSKGAHLKAGAFEYLRCGACGTLQRQMTREQYLAMEPGYDPGLFLANADEATIRRYLHVDQHKRTLQSLCDDIGLAPAGARLLDIGCGMGGFLLAGRDLGMVVEGFEPSENHGLLAREVLKLPVTQDYFTGAAVGDRRYDIIILSEVIEHIYDQKAFLEDVVSVLAPGGVVRMITPNADSLAARITGTRWPMLVPIDHVGLITKRSVPYIVPDGHKAKVRTVETPFTFAATLASVLKASLRGRPVNESGADAVAAPKTLEAQSLKGKLVRGALAAASAPFYLAARLTDRAVGLETRIFSPRPR